MSLVAGASRFISTATLSNTRGLAAQTSNILEQTLGAVNLLDVGRQSTSGLGLSSRARLLNNQQLKSTSATYNQLFSMSGGGSSTVESALIQIRGLMAKTPTSRETPEILAARGSSVDKSI